MIESIKIKVRRTNSSYLLHDVKRDIHTLSEAINKTIAKVNEIAQTVNEQGDMIAEIAKHTNWN